MKRNRHISEETTDDFFTEFGILDEVKAMATKKLFVLDVLERMKATKVTKAEVARRMSTSRTTVERLLDPDNNANSLESLLKLAAALRLDMRITLAERKGRVGTFSFRAKTKAKKPAKRV